MGTAIFTFRDYGTPGELSSVTVPIVDLTGANLDAQALAADAFYTALLPLVVGGIDSKTLIAWKNETSVATTDPFAQRETKWLIRYADDTTGAIHYMEVPCANLDKLDPTKTDYILSTDADVVTFKSAFHSLVRINGHQATVQEIIHVGRKS